MEQPFPPGPSLLFRQMLVLTLSSIRQLFSNGVAYPIRENAYK
jgi:hypothetical protein